MTRRRKIILAAGIFLALAGASAWLTMHRGPEKAVEAYKQLLRDNGEKLEISEVLPPAVPEASNGASLMEEAFKLFVPAVDDANCLPPAMQMIAAGKALTGASQPYWPGEQPDSSNGWENARAMVDASSPAFESLAQAATFPVIDFHPDYYTAIFSADMRRQYLLIRAARRLSAAAVCDLHDGNGAEAVTNISVLLALVQELRNGRLGMVQSTRMGMAGVALNTTWEALQSTNVPAAELAKLQARWGQLDFIGSEECAVEMERAMAGRLIQTLRTSKPEFARIMGVPAGGPALSFTSTGDWLEDVSGVAKEGWEGSKTYGGMMMWQNAWSYDDELRTLQKRQIELEALRSARTNAALKAVIDWQEAQLSAITITNETSALVRLMDWGSTRWLFSEGPFHTRNSLRRFVSIEAARQMTIAAIALRRFQLAQGKLPEKLSELAPDFLPTEPMDPMDGKPLRYHPNPDGTFLMYSVGGDGVDDGGDATSFRDTSSSGFSWNWLRARDWVWPQPATAAEVKKYYEDKVVK